MKRLIFTVMAVGLLMACGGGSTDTMRRLQQAARGQGCQGTGP